ncbi:hypothetical protein [Streptomyces sp. NPDC059262]|uniref:hypothetical protein n=1 Tax=Streptomyces sp. NPDC059262 TaxID=3346797 RepID=UPI0036A4092B
MDLARLHSGAAIVIENPNFTDARTTRREKFGRGRSAPSTRCIRAGGARSTG